ncbi:MAG: DUF1501 domain-containing protein [Sandaracinaceae bacterium]
MTMDRRTFLRGLSAAGLGAATMGGITSALAGFSSRARAADVTGYKALVCVFLLGGMDNHDTLIPYDRAEYDNWARIRRDLLGRFPGGNRERSALVPLAPDNAPSLGGRQVALPPELSGVAGLFGAGQAAIVGNVGPLLEPVTRRSFEERSARLPTRLFSHNDQQATWMSGSPEGAARGWGGLFADAVLAADANRTPELTAITTGGHGLFLTGRAAAPYQVGDGGAATVEVLGELDGEGPLSLLREHFRGGRGAPTHLLQRDMQAAMANTLDLNQRFNDAREGLAPLATDFGEGPLTASLRAVAETIALRDILGMRRQVFLVAMGGYDTHSNQAQDLPRLHAALDRGVTSFFAAMQELGVEDDVTLFTASDFGRSLAINGDGTDHGWAGHHLVVGGGVRGRRIHGDVPVAELGHDHDAGSGRLIPTVSVDQMAAPLGRWFGLDEVELGVALPALASLTGPPLDLY